MRSFFHGVAYVTDFLSKEKGEGGTRRIEDHIPRRPLAQQREALLRLVRNRDDERDEQRTEDTPVREPCLLYTSPEPTRP